LGTKQHKYFKMGNFMSLLLEFINISREEDAQPQSEDVPSLPGLTSPEDSEHSSDDRSDDSDSEESQEEDDDLDQVVDKAAANPDRQGQLRQVPDAHLVYKREQDDGTFEELWVYKSTELRTESRIKAAILAGTDIKRGRQKSDDGSQAFQLWTAGNVEMICIKGLPS